MGNVHGDLYLTTNCKSDGTSEVWGKKIEGVEYPFVYNGSNSQTLDVSKHMFLGRDKDQGTYVYIKPLPGYSNDSNDITVTVTIDGQPYSCELRSTSDLKNQMVVGRNKGSNITEDTGKASSDGAPFYIYIPRDSAGRNQTFNDGFQPLGYTASDIRISVIAKKAEVVKNYTISYESDGVQVASDPIELGKSALVGEGVEIPTKDGYVFQGWKIDGLDTVFTGSQVFTATEELATKVSDNEFVYTFVAQWVEKAKATDAPYKVNVFFPNAEGEYGEAALSLSQLGAIDKTAFVIEDGLKAALASESGKLPANWQEDYVLDSSKPLSVVVKGDGSSSIDVYYVKNVFDVTFQPGDHGTGDVVVTPAHKGDSVKALADAAQKSFTPQEGYDFVGWSPEVTEATKVAGPTTYVAQWKAKEYIVTFKPGDHAAADATAVTKTVKHNTNLESAGIAPEFEGAAGWMFDGWSPELSNNVTENQTYTAQWKKDESSKHAASIKIEYYLDGAHQAAKDELVTKEGLLADSVTVDAASSIDLNQFPGYKREKTEGSTSFMLAAGAATPAEPQVVKVYLVKDTTKMHTARAQVQYWVGETVATAELKGVENEISDTAWLGDPITLTLTANTTNKFPGYKYDAQASDPLIYTLDAFAASNATAQSVKIYYLKDATQTHQATIKVNYWYGETVEAAKLKAQEGAAGALKTPDFAAEFKSAENGWMGADATVTAEVVKNLQSSTDPKAAGFKGYKYDSHEGDLTFTLEAGKDSATASWVVNVYYVKDVQAQHSVSAQVKYYFGKTLADAKAKATAGTPDAVSDVVEETGWLNASVTVTPQVEANKFVGYKEAERDGGPSFTVAAGAASSDSNVISVYYVKDESKTHSATITVEYYRDGVLQSDKTDSKTASGWINDPVTASATINKKLNETDPDFYGYNYASSDPANVPATVSAVATAGNGDMNVTVKVYYEKNEADTHAAAVTVNYFYGETVEDAKAKTTPDFVESDAPAAVWMGSPVSASVTVDKALATSAKEGAEKFKGYKFDSAVVADSTEEVPADGVVTNNLAAGDASSTKVVNVYYEKDSSQTHVATVQVNYWYGRTLADAQAKAEAAGAKADYSQSFRSDANGSETWLGAIVSVTADVDQNLQTTNASFAGYRFNSADADRTLTLAQGEASDTKVVNVYYTEDDSESAKHSASMLVRYVAGDKELLETHNGTATWINEPASVSATVNTKLNESSNPDHAAFKGYMFDSVTVGGQAAELDADGKVSSTLAAGEATPEQPVVVVVTYVKDEKQTHTASVTVNYWVGDTLEAAKAAASAENAKPVYTQSSSETKWVKDSASASVAINENLQNSTDADLLAKFAGYAFGGTNEVEPQVVLGENVDSLSKTVNVYYVKNANDTHMATIQVNYFYGNTLVEAQAKDAADFAQTFQSKLDNGEGWMGSQVTASGEVDLNLQNSTDPKAAGFKGYAFDSAFIGEDSVDLRADSTVSKTLAIGESETSPMVVNVYYVKDADQKHSVSAKIEYYYGRTLDEAMGKPKPDAYEEYGNAENRINYTTAEGWLGEDVSLTVTANLNKDGEFSGYKVAFVTVNDEAQELEGENYPADYEFMVKKGEASGEFDFENTNTVRVYYVANENIKHYVSAQVNYYFGNTLEEAQAKAEAGRYDAQDAAVTESAWLHDAVSVAPMINFAMFPGYTVAASDNARVFSVAAGVESAINAPANIVNVYYTPDEQQLADVTYEAGVYADGEFVAGEGGSTMRDGSIEAAVSDQVQVVTGEGVQGSVRPVAANGYRFVGWQKVASDGTVVEASATAEGNLLSAADVKANLNEADGLFADTTFRAVFEPNWNDGPANAVTVTGISKVYDAQDSGIVVNGTVADDIAVFVDANGQEQPIENARFTNVTEQTVTVKVKRGSFTKELQALVSITARPVTIQTATAEKVYDGTELTAPRVSVKPYEGDAAHAADYGLVDGDNVQAVFGDSASQTQAGSKSNTFDRYWIADSAGNDDPRIEDNYSVTVEYGTLTVTPQSLVPDDTNPDAYKGITVEQLQDVQYNGAAQAQIPAVRNNAGVQLVNGVDFDLVYSDDVTNAGIVTVQVVGKGNYAGTLADIDELTYRITPKPVTITVADAGKTFDTEDPEFEGSVEGLVNDADLGQITYGRISSQESVGVYADDLIAQFTANDNYDVTVEPGTFTIVAATDNLVTVAGDAQGLTKTYNGQPSTVVAQADKAGSTLLYSLDGEVWAEQAPTFTNAGSYQVYVKATNPNYTETEPVSATVVINPAPVTITVASAAKVAGTQDPQFSGTVSGVLEGDDFGTVEYYRTNAAEDAATYEGVLTARVTRTNGNYADPVIVPGTFTITPAPVVPTPTPGTDTPADGGTTPGDGGTPAPLPTPTPAPATPATPAPATPTPAAATPTPAAATPAPVETIEDEATPLAANPGTTTPQAQDAPVTASIEDEPTPLAAGPEEELHSCWVHYVIFLGIVLTIIYGFAAVTRRVLFSRKLEEWEDDLTSGGTPASGTASRSGAKGDAPAYREYEPAIAMSAE